MVEVEPVMAGQASAIDIPTGAGVQLNLQDPDSMTLDVLGNLVLDSQGDQQLLIMSNPGSSNQSVLRLPLTYLTPSGPMAVETDDTTFTTSDQGFILFADKQLNKVYKLARPGFSPGVAYTAADGGAFVGTLDLTTGVITPVVTGPGEPCWHGLRGYFQARARLLHMERARVFGGRQLNHAWNRRLRLPCPTSNL